MKKFISIYIRDITYGAIDGAVTTFAIVAGVIGAKLSSQTILILGISNLIADGFSMGSSCYLSVKADMDIKDTKKFEHTPLLSGLFTFVSFIIIGSAPLIIFIFDYFYPNTVSNPFFWSCIISALSFFLVGSSKSFFTKRAWLSSGIETLIIGGIAALVAYYTGSFLKQVIPNF